MPGRRELSPLPVAPRFAQKIEPPELIEQNRASWRDAVEAGAESFEAVVLVPDDDGDGWHHCRDEKHVVQGEARYGRPTWTQARISDDGQVRVRDHGAARWRVWRWPLVRSGRAPRPATNGRPRGSRRGTRSNSSSSDDPGEADLDPARTCPVCGSGLDDLRRDATYCGSGCRREASRRRRRQTGPVDGDQVRPDPADRHSRAEQVDQKSAARMSDQPKREPARRIPVTRRIVAELDRAGNRHLVPELLGFPGYPGPLIGLPESRTYVELARAVYETPEPNVAQVKAVQRAATRLEAAGRIEQRRRSGEVVVRRLLTEADHRYRAEVEQRVQEWKEARAEAEANATTYSIDSGYGGIVEVPVEPVLIISENGVELRVATDDRAGQNDRFAVLRALARAT